MTPSYTGGSFDGKRIRRRNSVKKAEKPHPLLVRCIMKSIRYTPGYIYLLAIILALPATWLVVGRSGQDVPGMIAMIVTIVFFGIFSAALGSLRRRLQKR